jgi:hypothetical protein
MKHASSQELFAYWNAQRGPRPVPDRGDIDPGAIRAVLGDTFILTADPRAGHPFRLAGTRICALFCRELKGEAFASLWAQDGRAEIKARVGIVADETIGLVANAKACNAEGATLDLELLLLPLASRGNSGARIIGTLAPSEAPYWLGVSPITSVKLGSFRHLDAELERNAPLFVSGLIAEKLALAAATASGGMSALDTLRSLPSAPRLQHGLRVYEGGRVG